MNVLKSNVLETQIYYQEEGTKLAILLPFEYEQGSLRLISDLGGLNHLLFFFFLVGTWVDYELIYLNYLKDSWLDLLCNAFNLPSRMNWVLCSEGS